MVGNLDAKGRRQRLVGGIVMLLAAGAVSALLILRDASPTWQWGAFPLFLFGFNGLFQAGAST